VLLSPSSSRINCMLFLMPFVFSKNLVASGINNDTVAWLFSFVDESLGQGLAPPGNATEIRDGNIDF